MSLELERDVRLQKDVLHFGGMGAEKAEVEARRNIVAAIRDLTFTSREDIEEALLQIGIAPEDEMIFEKNPTNWSLSPLGREVATTSILDTFAARTSGKETVNKLAVHFMTKINSGTTLLITSVIVKRVILALCRQ